VIHHGEALCFELRGSHLLHDELLNYDQNNMTSYFLSNRAAFRVYRIHRRPHI